MVAAMKSFDDIIASPLDPAWCQKGAPDANSMIAAVRVQMLLAAGSGDQVDYLVETHGCSYQEAEKIVANCRQAPDE